MELSLDNISLPEEKEGSKFPTKLKAGNHKVKVSKVEKVTNPTAGTPALEITVEDELGAVCTHRFQLNPVPKEAGKESAWSITAKSLIYLIIATNNVDEAGAKAKMVGLSHDNIDTKISSLLIGKLFGINLKGEHMPNSDITKDSWIKVEFGGWHFARPIAEFDKLPKSVYIKGIPVKGTASNNANGGITTVKEGDDLPW